MNRMLLRLKDQRDLAIQTFTDILYGLHRQRTSEFLPNMRLREMGLEPIELRSDQCKQPEEPDA